MEDPALNERCILVAFGNCFEVRVFFWLLRCAHLGERAKSAY